jgi:hypothetical protein
LLVTLRSAKHLGWTHSLTGDESWFWLTIDCEQQWLLSGAERPTRPSKMNSSPKAIISIFWSPLGFPVIQVLPPKVTFTSKLFIDAILLHIVAAKPAVDPGRRLVLHMDNASPPRAILTARNPEQNRMTTNRHLAFSPDLTPSGFFLFGALKGQISGCISGSPDELVEAIREVATAIPRTTFERAFLEWEERLHRCIDINGAYVD